MNKIKTPIVFACMSLVLLILLVHFFPHSSVDIYISKHLQEEVDEPRDIKLSSPVSWISILGNGIVAPISVLVVSLVFFITRNRKEALYVLFVFVADLLVWILKWAVHRPRPTGDDVKILQTFAQPSFPSGHVVHYVVFFGFLLAVILYQKKFTLPLRVLLSVFLISLILMIPISRVYLGAHWATDVLGGYLVGFICLLIIMSFYLKKQVS